GFFRLRAAFGLVLLDFLNSGFGLFFLGRLGVHGGLLVFGWRGRVKNTVPTTVRAVKLEERMKFEHENTSSPFRGVGMRWAARVSRTARFKLAVESESLRSVPES